MRPAGLQAYHDRAQTKPCGSTGKYQCGCRCLKCKVAAAAYAREHRLRVKRGERNSIISAADVREHLLALSRGGVGAASVAEAASVARCIVKDIASGKRPRCRMSTARHILAVTIEAASDYDRIDSRAAWQMIDQLRSDGFSLHEIAVRLGYAHGTLQFKRQARITARNAMRVEKLYRQIYAGDPAVLKFSAFGVPLSEAERAA